LRDLLVEREVDLYYTSHYTVDRLCPVPFSFTIHDLTRWRFPELSYSDASFTERFGIREWERVKTELAELAAFDSTSPDAGVFTRYFTALNRHLAARARRIVTVSHATAADITSLLAVPGEQIDLVPCAVDTAVFHPRSAAEVRSVREKHQLDGPYLVFVGLTHPNKRFEWLVTQLAANRSVMPPGAKLAAVGGHADQVPGIRQTLHDLEATDFVAFTGRISDDELAALYTGACAWVTASVNEGNNLPPLEALSCGSQVIATDIPPLRETVGPGGHFYAPTDATALVRLAGAALAGSLPPGAGSYTPPSWNRSGALLTDAWMRAVKPTAS
jgi:glycosyltransferase involved in cell wall biosynthesis